MGNDCCCGLLPREKEQLSQMQDASVMSKNYIKIRSTEKRKKRVK